MMRAFYLLVCALLALPLGAQAASCSVSPPQASIGQYDPITSTSGVRGIFQIGVQCSAATSFVVTAGPSQTSGSISLRQLRGENPTSILNYQLCLDANWGGDCNLIFGTPPDGNSITGNIASAGGNVLVVFWALVYGNQPAKPGWHTDYVTINVEP